MIDFLGRRLSAGAALLMLVAGGTIGACGIGMLVAGLLGHGDVERRPLPALGEALAG